MLEPPDLGPRLRSYRQAAELTLDDLAKASGVSRSMLSQIERGQSNPTFATLWSLTQALDLPLEELVAADHAGEERSIITVDRSATPKLHNNETGAVLWLLGPAELVGRTEWYELLLEPGGHLTAQAHASGTTEHLTVLAGAVTVASGSAHVEVSEGETARYAADVDHRIVNDHDESTRALLVVIGAESR